MNEKIEQTLQKFASAQKAWDELFDLMVGGGLHMDRSYSNLSGSSLNELNARINATMVLGESLRNMEEGGLTLVIPRLPAIDGPLTQIIQQASTASNQFRNYPECSFSDPSGNLNIHIMRGGSVVTTWLLSSHLESISAHQMPLLDQLTLSLRFGRYKGIGLFQERAKEMQSMSAELTSILSTSQAYVRDIASLIEKGTAIIEECEGAQDVCADRKAVIVALTESAQKSTAEIEAKLARIREVTSAASSLEEQVTDYHDSFEAFKESLDERLAAHEKFTSDTKDALKRNVEREGQIELLITKSDTMIKGATTAGLSLSLDQTKDAYEKRLVNTGRWFIGSVTVLLICLIPIAGQLVPGPWQEWFKESANGNTDPWLAALGKVVLLLPATWASAFFANNYAELFHLHREYAHKAAMAKAIDGFKREAPDYQEEIVAGVFMEIRENPGARKAPNVATPQNPITASLFEKVLGAMRSKKEGS